LYLLILLSFLLPPQTSAQRITSDFEHIVPEGSVIPDALLKYIIVNPDSVTLEAALRDIGDRCGCSFNYIRNRIPADTPVTIQEASAPAVELLIRALQETDTQLLIVGKDQLIIQPIPPSKIPVSKATSRIKGRTTDSETGEPLKGVSVVIDGTRLGTASTEIGTYRISEITPGSYRLVFNMVGYKTRILRRVELNPGETVVLDVDLKPRPFEMETISVTVDRNRQLVDQLQPSTRRVHAVDVGSLAGGGEDLFRTIQTLPGVTARSDLSSQFYVRGGTPDQNLVIIDGVPVFNPYRLRTAGGPISMFNPDVIDYVELMPGGFPAEYGDKLSAVLLVRNKEGDRLDYHYKASASMIDLKTFVEGPLPATENNGSWFLSARRTHYDLLYNQLESLPRGTVRPFFRDYQGKLTFDPAPNQIISFNFLDSQESSEVENLAREEGRDGYVTENEGAGFSSIIKDRLFSVGWKIAINEVTLSELTLSHLSDTWSEQQEWSNPVENSYLNNYSETYMRKMEIREDLLHMISLRHTLQAGLNLTYYITDITVETEADLATWSRSDPEGLDGGIDQIRQDYRLQKASTTLGIYLQDEFRVVPETFSVLPGVRVDYSSYTREWVYSPRISFTYRLLPDLAWRGGWGYYYQAPNFASLFERFDDEIESAQLETVKLRAEQSIHLLSGIEWQPSEGYTTNLELYYRYLDNLIVPTDSTHEYIPNNTGEGFAYGFELFLQKKDSPRTRLSGRASYSYSITKERDRYTEFNFRDFDQPHSVSLVLNYKSFKGVSLDTQYKFASGFPLTPIVLDNLRNPRFVDQGNPVEGELNSQRYPNYERLDIRLSWQKRFSNDSQLLLYFEILNILNRKNVDKYYWSDDFRTRYVSYMLPRMPFFGIKFER